MLAYLIEREETRQIERDEQKQKDLILATNPELYFQIWPVEEVLTEEEEDEIEFLIPETEADVQAMMAELRSAGWGG